jgi:ribonuclease P protein 3
MNQKIALTAKIEDSNPEHRNGPVVKRSTSDDDVLDAEARPNRPKRIKQKHMDPVMLEFRRCVQQCCATNDFRRAMDAYDKAVLNGTRIEAQSLYNLLNLCDGLGDRPLHVGSPKESTKDKTYIIAADQIDDETRKTYAQKIKQHMTDQQLPLTETAYSALVKLFARTGDIELAESTLCEAEKTQQCKPKLRMYAPLLAHYCEKGDMPNAVRIWLRISKRGLFLAEKEYAFLIQCSVKAGNALVMERVLSDLSEDVLIPSRETRQVIIDWFQSPASCTCNDTDATITGNTEINNMLQEIEIPYAQQVQTMGPVQCRDVSGWTVSDECHIDPNGTLLTGCMAGAKLQPISLSDAAWQEMKNMNETIVKEGKLQEDASEFQGGRKGRKHELDSESLQKRRESWEKFCNYLKQRKQIDIVLDGANLG